MNSNNNNLIPQMPINVPTNTSPVTDHDLLNLYNEILDDLRSDRTQVDDLLSSFVEMVINEGDSSSASKEALVNLAKLKSDIASSKGKVADLMTSLRLKDRQIGKIQANQTNNITITDRRNLIEAINKLKKKEAENELD
jgi:septation ring formation regulator EzrA